LGDESGIEKSKRDERGHEKAGEKRANIFGLDNGFNVDVPMTIPLDKVAIPQEKIDNPRGNSTQWLSDDRFFCRQLPLTYLLYMGIPLN
jgi:hypothetical protein